MSGPTREELTEFWLREYLSDGGLCCLCGNHGIIDTTGRVSSPAGVECGRKVHCICPNGRALKARDDLFSGKHDRATDHLYPDNIKKLYRTDPTRALAQHYEHVTSIRHRFKNGDRIELCDGTWIVREEEMA